MGGKIALIAPPGPNLEVVRQLEGLLEKAKTGEILAIIYVCDLRGGERASGWTGCEDLDLLAGFVTRMQHNIQRRIDLTVGAL